jgi:hypothetical protein
MTIRITRRITHLSAALLAAALASSIAAQAQDVRLEPRQQNGITYVTGGVGTEEQDLMRSLGQQGYTLNLVFAEERTGAYVANVHVTVADRAGRTLLDAVADGPAFFAKLPPGDYRVSAEYKGYTQSRTVPAGSATPKTMYWVPEPGSAPMPASAHAPHGEGAGLAPVQAGESAEAPPPR